MKILLLNWGEKAQLNHQRPLKYLGMEVGVQFNSRTLTDMSNSKVQTVYICKDSPRRV